MQEALYQAVKPCHDFMWAGLPWGLICVPVVAPLIIFLHELGHALVARRVTGQMVKIVVGKGRNLTAFTVGLVNVDLNLWLHPLREGGQMRADLRGVARRDLVWIVLAGPVASLLSGVGAAILYSAAPDSGVLHLLLWAATLQGLFGALLSLIPMSLQERRGGPAIRNDGRLVLDILRSPTAQTA
jgi:hypothetical protein